MSNGDGGVTLGELARAIAELKVEMAEMRADLSRLPFVRQDVWSAERRGIEGRIEGVRDDLGKTQENLRWLVRAIVGVVLTAVFSALLFAVGIR